MERSAIRERRFRAFCPSGTRCCDCSSRKGAGMLFMIIERFRDNDMVPVYQRLRDSGRSLPDGLEYVDSWIEPNFARCFQLMSCDDPRLFEEWVLHWRGFGVTFEIVRVGARK